MSCCDFHSLLVPTMGMASDQEPRQAWNEVSIDLSLPIVYNLAVSSPDNVNVVPTYLGYQRLLTNHLALFFSPGIMFIQQTQMQLSVLTFWLELDWHPFQEGLQGFFLGPAVVLLYGSDNSTARGNILLAGGAIGYQFLFPANFDIDVSLGLSIGPEQASGPRPVIPRGIVALGYRF